MSSLTVARQRGIHTRFPVFAERQRRASQMKCQRAEKPCQESNGIRWRSQLCIGRKDEVSAKRPTLPLQHSQPRSGESVQPTAQAVG